MMSPSEQSYVKPTINEPEFYWCRVCDAKFLKRFSLHHFTTAHSLAPAQVEDWCVVADGRALANCNCNHLEAAARELPQENHSGVADMPRGPPPARGDLCDVSLEMARTPGAPPAAPPTMPAPTMPAASAAATSPEPMTPPFLSYMPMPRRTRRMLSPGAKAYAVREAVAATNARGARPSTQWFHTELWRAGLAIGKWDAATNPEGIRAHCRKELTRLGL